MHNPSPKARSIIQLGIDLLQRREDSEAWVAWSRRHPFVRTDGPVNQAQERMSNELAKIVLSGLGALANHIEQKLGEPSISREEAIAFENDLSYIQDIETEIQEDLRARV
jgi:hypothetical protein